MGLQIDMAMWEESLENIYIYSIDVRHHIIQFKVIHRLHYSKARLHKIDPDVSPFCDRYRAAEGTLFHSFRSCHKISSYWGNRFELIQENTQKTGTRIHVWPF